MQKDSFIVLLFSHEITCICKKELNALLACHLMLTLVLQALASAP